MTTPQTQSQPPVSTSDGGWGAPAEPQKWTRRKTATAGAVAAVIVVGGGAAIWVGSSSSTDTTAAGQGGQFGGQPPGGMTARGGAGALATALHGEYVVADGNGGYTTQLMQTGKVTALSATSLTAQSDDGFSKVYTITSALATGITTGETVTVVATTSGTTATAKTVTEAGTGTGAPAGRQAPPQSN